MKLLFKIGMVCCALNVGLQAIEATEETPRTKYVLDYKKPEAFMEDFKDLSKKPDQPLRYWAAQLIMFLQADPKLKPFCFDFAKVIRYKNPLRIGYVFLAHQHLFSQGLQDLVLKDFNRVWSALETRSKL